MLLALPLELAIGLALGMVGGGGSILALPVLVYVLGEGVKVATTESLLIVGAAALIGSFDHMRAGRVRWRIALLFGAAGAVGSIAGTALNRLVSPHAILLAFALVLLVAAFAVARGRGEAPRAEIQPRGHGVWLRIVPAGLATGLLTGFFGVGGGFAVVPMLVLGLGLPLTSAVGTSLVVIAITSGTALAAHLSTGTIHWATGGTFIVAAVTGAVVGSRVGARIPQQQLARVFAVLVFGIGTFLIATSVSTWA